VRLFLIVLALVTGFGSLAARGEVTEYENGAAWYAAVGEVTTIDFTDQPAGSIITDQYASLGVHFTDGNDIAFAGPSIFPNDAIGLRGHIVQPSGIHIAFDTLQRWLAVEFPGGVDIQLFRDGDMFHESNLLGVGGIGNFAGLVSTIGFDAAYIDDSADFFVFIDDPHFGVPGRGILPLLALAAMMGGAAAAVIDLTLTLLSPSTGEGSRSRAREHAIQRPIIRALTVAARFTPLRRA
jgi:hypothetical protein